jgi:hypothetical protein
MIIEYMTIDEARVYLGISQKKLNKLIHQGFLKTVPDTLKLGITLVKKRRRRQSENAVKIGRSKTEIDCLVSLTKSAHILSNVFSSYFLVPLVYPLFNYSQRFLLGSMDSWLPLIRLAQSLSILPF